MKRETWANLIFLGVFLAVSVPGAVILFKKKLDPTSAPMGMPDFIRRRLPYMVPLVTPDSQVIRVIPPKTGAWVSELNREHAGGADVLMNGASPVTSPDRVVQVAGIREEGGGTTVYVLAWEGGYGVDVTRYQVSATPSGGEAVAGRVVGARTIAMPQPVKRELMHGGYVKPSAEVTWVEVRFDAPLSGKRPLALKVDYAARGDGGAGTVVNLSG